MVTHSRSRQHFGDNDMTRLGCAPGALLGVNIWNRHPFWSPSDVETGSYAIRRILKSYPEGPH